MQEGHTWVKYLSQAAHISTAHFGSLVRSAEVDVHVLGRLLHEFNFTSTGNKP